MATGYLIGDGDLLIDAAGAVLIDPECCCRPVTCCDSQIISGQTVLVATITGESTAACVGLGGSVELDDLDSPTIWNTGDMCLTPANTWAGLQWTCENDNPMLRWYFDGACPGNNCPSIDTSVAGDWSWELIEGQCSPFSWKYCYNIDETMLPGLCACDTGRICVELTIKPPAAGAMRLPGTSRKPCGKPKMRVGRDGTLKPVAQKGRRKG